MIIGSAQDKNILKTVLAILAVMLVILALFFNKITTPRFLSSIELTINGYVLLNTNKDGSRKDSENILEFFEPNTWFIIVDNDSQREVIENVLSRLKNPMKSNTAIVSSSDSIKSKLVDQLPDRDDIIAVINDDNKLSGYFKPPFDRQKMTLTYSSVFTHR